MKPLIFANWKANPPTLAEAKKLLTETKRGLGRKQKTEMIVCPPFVFLSELKRIAGKSIKLGSQDVFWREGAFTGQISAKMLRSLNCDYVIIGHGERRFFFFETDEMINKKIKAVIFANLFPILCIGETEKEKKEGKTKKVLEKQLELALQGISKFKILSRLVIAYEPIWAIGTGKSCDIDTASSMNLLIRKILGSLYSKGVSQKIRIVYGGSVNSDNALGYIEEAQMDGLLIGGASLNAKKMVAILEKF